MRTESSAYSNHTWINRPGTYNLRIWAVVADDENSIDEPAHCPALVIYMPDIQELTCWPQKEGEDVGRGREEMTAMTDVDAKLESRWLTNDGRTGAHRRHFG
jgi:hypothetical protein